MAVFLDFVEQTTAGVFGAFAGVFLALLADRYKQRREAARREQEQLQEYGRGRLAVLGSVVKNTAEARRISRVLDGPKGDPLLHSGLEVAVWEATRDQFIRLCASAEERGLFAQFFDAVRRLQRFLEYRRGLHTSLLTMPGGGSAARLDELLNGIDRELHSLADDVRLSGTFLVTDFGLPVHKRMLGVAGEAAPSAEVPVAAP